LILDLLPKKNAAPFQQIFQAFMQQHQLAEEIEIQNIPPNLTEYFLYGSPEILEFELISHGERQHYKGKWQGFIPFLNKQLQEKKSKNSLSEFPFVEWKICPMCKGGRLKPESLACLIKGKNIDTLCKQTVDQLLTEIGGWEFSGKEEKIAKEIIPSILTR